MTSRIEQIIEEIEEYIDGCNYSPLSKKNIVVNKEEIEELLRELRMKTPEEIKRYQKILANKDAILADAQAKAESIVNQANLQLNEMISEQEIMKQAYAQANAVVEAATAQAQEILNSAAADANEIRMGAMQYTDSMLANMQSIIQNTMESYNSRYASLINSLNGYYEMIEENRQELAPTIYGEAALYEEAPEEVQE
ncbi:MAG: ATPase [Lachnospiraceae bacterium]|nr:ATPase [Lachnospiraceae bacterium]